MKISPFVQWLAESKDAISRLDQLGLVPERSVSEWLQEILEDSEDFKIIAMAVTRNIVIGRPWARTDVWIKLPGADSPSKIVMCQLSADGDLTGVPLSYPVPSHLTSRETALEIVKILKTKFGRGRLTESAEPEEDWRKDFIKDIERLVELGLIEEPKYSYQWLVHLLSQLYPDLTVDLDRIGSAPTITVKLKTPGDQRCLIFQKGMGQLYLVFRVDLEHRGAQDRLVDQIQCRMEHSPGKTFPLALKFLPQFTKNISKWLGVEPKKGI